MSRLKRLIVEIHRRSLWQVLLVYVGGALVAYQAVQALTEGLGLPHWFPGLAVVLFIIGLPFVVASALVRETTAPAMPPSETGAAASVADVAEPGVPRAGHRAHITWRNAGLSFVVALAVWGAVATGWWVIDRSANESGTAHHRPSVAVLPLENRSGLEEDEYFTDGIHDEILTQLYKISGLSVRARTSVMEYRDSPKNIRQIGEELNARYLMEGGVQRAGETVRINVQLVDSETDEHVFAETYDRELSLENLLAVQREVALSIADALEATLTPAERQHIEDRPTENLEAYESYLRGRYLCERWTPEDMNRAIEYLQQAIERDPGYAAARSELALCNLLTYRCWPVPELALHAGGRGWRVAPPDGAAPV